MSSSVRDLLPTPLQSSYRSHFAVVRSRKVLWVPNKYGTHASHNVVTYIYMVRSIKELCILTKEEG